MFLVYYESDGESIVAYMSGDKIMELYDGRDYLPIENIEVFDVSTKKMIPCKIVCEGGVGIDDGFDHFDIYYHIENPDGEILARSFFPEH